jgi:hypothetical protein
MVSKVLIQLYDVREDQEELSEMTGIATFFAA